MAKSPYMYFEPDRIGKDFQIDGFDEQIRRIMLQAALYKIFIGITRNVQGFDVRSGGPNPLGQLHAVHSGHDEIGDQQVDHTVGVFLQWQGL